MQKCYASVSNTGLHFETHLPFMNEFVIDKSKLN